jgi:hypothetical protein
MKTIISIFGGVTTWKLGYAHIRIYFSRFGLNYTYSYTTDNCTQILASQKNVYLQK